jgi:hypothetical protein
VLALHQGAHGFREIIRAEQILVVVLFRREDRTAVIDVADHVRVRLAAVLGLHVEQAAAMADVGVNP